MVLFSGRSAALIVSVSLLLVPLTVVAPVPPAVIVAALLAASLMSV